MKRRTAKDWALLGRVWAEIGAGKVRESFISGGTRLMVDGLCDHGTGYITINPAHQTIDSLIHEILHRLHPHWSEGYVRNRTSYLRHRMTDDEVRAMYDEYSKRKRTRKRPVTLEGE